MATLSQVSAQGPGSQLEREGLVRQVDAMTAAGNNEVALKVARRLVASSDAQGTQESFRVLALVKLSFAYRELAHFAEAENALRLALAVVERSNSVPDETMAVLLGGLGDLTYRQSFTGGLGRRCQLWKGQRWLPRCQSLRRILGQVPKRLRLLNIHRQVSENIR